MSTLEWIVYYFELLPIIVFLVFLLSKRKPAISLWVILIYSTCSFANNSKVVYDILHHNDSSIFFYIFTVVEYLLFATFIYTALEKLVYKRALLLCSVLFTCFCLFNIFFEIKYQFDSLQTSIEAIILLIFCILYFFEQITKPEMVLIYSSYKFWVVLAILIYLATSFFLFVFSATIPIKQLQEYWIINHFSNILKNVLFAIAIIVQVKLPKSPGPLQSGGTDLQPFLN